jgi:hypothetical protein
MWHQLPDLARERDRDRQNRSDGDERIAEAVGMLALTAAMAVVWPIAAVMLVTVAAAWATGMHYARILRAALWSASMAGAYIVAATVQDRPWMPGRLHPWAAQPYRDWHRATADLIHGTDC